jgi:hypothetical protein
MCTVAAGIMLWTLYTLMQAQQVTVLVSHIRVLYNIQNDTWNVLYYVYLNSSPQDNEEEGLLLLLLLALKSCQQHCQCTAGPCHDEPEAAREFRSSADYYLGTGVLSSGDSLANALHTANAQGLVSMPGPGR